MIRIERVISALPAGFDAMRVEARAEGHRMLDTLAAEWAAGTTRFDRPGEALFAAYSSRMLAGIGGMTIDPALSGALRMRRFYVRKSCRGGGIARGLAAALLDRPDAAGKAITANAAAGSEKFWEALGFVADRRNGCTHLLTATTFSMHPLPMP